MDRFDRRPPVSLRFPGLWDDIAEIKKRLEKLESKSDTYDVLFEIRSLSELDELIKQVREELQKHGVVFVTVEKHDN